MAKIDAKALAEHKADFSPDECSRRTHEVVRRMCGHPATFDLQTGQPLNGEQLTTAELRRRGYESP